MADHFLGALQALERRAQDNVLVFSDVLTERLDALAGSMLEQPISTNDYSKTLELYYQKYQRFENQEGMIFCVLRMQQLAMIVKKKKKPSFQYQEISPKLDERIQHFLNEHKEMYQKLREDSLRIWILASLAGAIGLMIVSVLFAHVPFMIGWLAAFALWIGLLVYGYCFKIEKNLEKQIVSLYPKLDDLHVLLDKSAMKTKKKDLLTPSQTKQK
ncbi:hypothetical protein [Faecalicoccus acidiformans]|uniref:hypothetical protein n=1 Tax=Faecalicoccus acidiformans TaxID=915173 RepID=UPI002352D5AE|nr:hypothetical protein [Faecalicoccus acidiformans]